MTARTPINVVSLSVVDGSSAVPARRRLAEVAVAGTPPVGGQGSRGAARRGDGGVIDGTGRWRCRNGGRWSAQPPGHGCVPSCASVAAAAEAGGVDGRYSYMSG